MTAPRPPVTSTIATSEGLSPVLKFDEKIGGLRHWLSVDGCLVQEDTRARQASLKNGPAVRQLPISLELLTAIDTYISQYRGEPAHEFFFNSLQDAPLAASTLDQVIATAVDCLTGG